MSTVGLKKEAHLPSKAVEMSGRLEIEGCTDVITRTGKFHEMVIVTKNRNYK